jgi:hypothetical protein
MPHSISRAVTKFQNAAVRLQKTKEKAALAERYTPLLTEFFREYEKKFLFRFSVSMRDKFPEETPIPTVGGIQTTKEDETAVKRGLEDATHGHSFGCGCGQHNNNAVVRNLAAPKKKTTTFALTYLTEALASIAFDTGPELQKILLRIERESLKQGADQMKVQFKGFDPDKSFDLDNPRAVAYFRKTGGSVSYIKDIQDTTATSIKSLVTNALENGWSYGKTATALRKLFDGPISRRRAELIAVTETAKAYEAGNRAFADSLKDEGVVMEKMWMNTDDQKVSDGCKANHQDGWIPLDQEHDSGDQEPPRFPGCRCWEIYREGNDGKA